MGRAETGPGGDVPIERAGRAIATSDEPSGSGDDYFTFCSQVSGTLQAVFPQVDELGSVLEGELSVILIEPGSLADDIDEPPEFSVHNGERFWMYADPDPFDIPANGRSASGTATVVESGESIRRPVRSRRLRFEASLEISC